MENHREESILTSARKKFEVGDIVIIREPDYPGAEAPKGIITTVDVPESEVEKFKDRLKEIVGKGEERQE